MCFAFRPVPSIPYNHFRRSTEIKLPFPCHTELGISVGAREVSEARPSVCFRTEKPAWLPLMRQQNIILFLYILIMFKIHFDFLSFMRKEKYS